jgi:hypothetical protein
VTDAQVRRRLNDAARVYALRSSGEADAGDDTGLDALPVNDRPRASRMRLTTAVATESQTRWLSVTSWLWHTSAPVVGGPVDRAGGTRAGRMAARVRVSARD